MADKNSHYKLDFKIKRDKSQGGNLTFNHFRRNYYWNQYQSWDIFALTKIVEELTASGNLNKLIPADFDIDKSANEAGITYHNAAEKNDFIRYMSLGHFVWYTQTKENFSKGSGLTHSTGERHQTLSRFLAMKSEKFKEYETTFKKWLSKRPGLVEVFEETYDYEPTLIAFAKAANDPNFRTRVENARPRGELNIGTLVRLKEKFINHSNKDPFYWTKDHKNTPRLGMISKFNENNAYGYGSRLLKIMWIATSEESYLMERELEILSE